MTPFLIPLQSFNQTFSVSLGGTVYVLTVRWNAANASWMMDVADQNGNAIASGIPLITGCDLFGQLKYLVIGGSGGQMTVQSTFDANAVPTYDNLGSTSNLFFVQP